MAEGATNAALVTKSIPPMQQQSTWPPTGYVHVSRVSTLADSSVAHSGWKWAGYS